VGESIRGSGRLVQGVAANLLHMHPADRRPFVSTLIGLIERIVDSDTDSMCASSMPANLDVHAVPEHYHPSCDDVFDFGPP
jgi:hypothetical protein